MGEDGAGRLAVGGVAVQIEGGPVMFGSLTVGLSRLCPCPVEEAVAPDRRAPLGGPLHNKLALLLALGLALSREGRPPADRTAKTVNNARRAANLRTNSLGREPLA